MKEYPMEYKGITTLVNMESLNSGFKNENGFQNLMKSTIEWEGVSTLTGDIQNSYYADKICSIEQIMIGQEFLADGA